MSPRRSSFQMAIDVLSVIAQGENRPTRIMYASNLSWTSLKSKLDLLLEKGYVDVEFVSNRSKLYSITSKGMDVLRYYKQLESLVEIAHTT